MFLLSSHIEDERSHIPKDTAVESAWGCDLGTRGTWVLVGGCPLAFWTLVCSLSHPACTEGRGLGGVAFFVEQSHPV